MYPLLSPIILISYLSKCQKDHGAEPSEYLAHFVTPRIQPFKSRFKRKRHIKLCVLETPPSSFAGPGMFTSWCLASSLDVVSDLQKFLVLQCHVLAVFVRDEKIERYDLKIFLFITSLKHFDYYMPSVFLNLNTIDVLEG